MPIWLSLAVIVVSLGVTTILSSMKSGRDPEAGRVIEESTQKSDAVER